MKQVIVIGGGIAGLSAAYYLRRKAAEAGASIRLAVLEASPQWGGKITTVRQDGFVIEGGPDTFLATKPWGVSLCKELGLDSSLQGTNPQHKNTYVLHNGELKPLPEGLTMMVPTRIEPMMRTKLLSWPAKARMGMDFLLPALPPNGDESLGAFVTRRLGRPAYERLIEPLMSGIYAGDGDQLSLQSTFPSLRELEIKYGGLVKGALAMRKKMSGNGSRAGVSRSVFLTPKTGLAEIVEKLVERLSAWGVSLRAGQTAQQIAWENQQYHIRLESGEILAADTLILATPAYVAGDLLAGLDADLASDLQAISYVSTATISLAYRTQDLPRPLDGYGYVIPRREGRRALACTWTSTKFPHRAPEGYSLLRVFAGRAGMEDHLPTDQAGLIQLAREELLQTLGITSPPLFSKVFFWEKAMPQYNLGHPARLQRIEAATDRLPGLFLAGNGYRGIGIPDCIHSGEKAAGKVLEFL